MTVALQNVGLLTADIISQSQARRLVQPNYHISNMPLDLNLIEHDCQPADAGQARFTFCMLFSMRARIAIGSW